MEKIKLYKALEKDCLIELVNRNEDIQKEYFKLKGEQSNFKVIADKNKIVYLQKVFFF